MVDGGGLQVQQSSTLWSGVSGCFPIQALPELESLYFSVFFLFFVVQNRGPASVDAVFSSL